MRVEVSTGELVAVYVPRVAKGAGMRNITTGLLVVATIGLACGSNRRDYGEGGGGDGGGGDGNGSSANGCTFTGSENTPAQCSDGIDNNCNGLIDCADPSCSGVGSCPICGQVQHPEGSAIDLPDGVCGTNGDGNCTCASDQDCAALSPAGQHCWTIGTGDQECRISYTSSVMFSSFGSDQKLMQPSDIVSVCADISHEWMRDLEIDLIAPSGEVLALDKFGGQTCATGVCEVYLGHPIDTDGDSSLSPEEGFQYCWMPTAAQKAILAYANAGGMLDTWGSGTDIHDVLPPSGSNGSSAGSANSYTASDPWTTLVGAQLNGTWTFAVTDLWPTDKGKLHGWTISFNPAIVQNCTTPPIQ
jgi:subtilisin-like proprotein convertase family protein